MTASPVTSYCSASFGYRQLKRCIYIAVVNRIDLISTINVWELGEKPGCPRNGKAN